MSIKSEVWLDAELALGLDPNDEHSEETLQAIESYIKQAYPEFDLEEE